MGRDEIDGGAAVRRAVREALVTAASRRPHARRLLRDARGQVGARDERAALHNVRELLRAERDAPPPLTPAVLGSLEATWLAADADDSCSICLERMCRGEEALQLACQHAYHAACLRTWLARSGSCPLCKHAVDESCARAASEEQRHTRRARSGAFLTTRTAAGLVLAALLLLLACVCVYLAALLIAGITLGAPPAAVDLLTVLSGDSGPFSLDRTHAYVAALTLASVALGVARL